MSAARASSIDKVNAMPLTAITKGLVTGTRQITERVEAVRAAQHLRAVLGHRRADLGQVLEARRAATSLGAQPTGSQLIIAVQDLVRAAQRVDDRQIEGIALGPPVDPYEQHMPVALHGDGLGHDRSPWSGCR